MKTILFFFLICFAAEAQTWSPVGAGLDNNNGRIHSMCEYNGELYVGGYFTSMAGLTVNSLAKWNGTQWDSVPGMSSWDDIEIFDMVVYNNELVIVGTEVYSWNGTSWSSVGGDIDNKQFATTVYNNELYVAGFFEHAGGISTRGIARWDGTAWDSVGGPGLNLSPGFAGRALETYNHELYLAGGFDLVNGLAAKRIAKWNGSVWDSIGAFSTTSDFHTLSVYNNKLYVGGKMTINNSTAEHFIYRWDNAAWDTVGYGLNGVPSSMTVYNNELYALDGFDTAGTEPVLCMARWNDLEWNSVGTGLDLVNINLDTIAWPFEDTMFIRKEFIYTSCTYNNELYIGGTFTKVGGVDANSIAKWHIDGVSVNETVTKLNGSFYPNPATNQLIINLNSTISDLKIYNTQGQLVTSSIVEGQHTTIDVSSFAAGLYYLTLQSKEGVITKKIEVVR
ncbi:MAG: hypothetical protein POELPBGB_02797 [Bacteroidia bacterium]|nr:hypothetical protein [Bacteroidia bacterium]